MGGEMIFFPIYLQELVCNVSKELFHVVRGLCRRLQEVHPVALGELCADVLRNLAVVAVDLVAWKRISSREGSASSCRPLQSSNNCDSNRSNNRTTAAMMTAAAKAGAEVAT